MPRHRPPGDMHGFSELNFALSGLFGLELRPWFATIFTQQFYNIDSVATYKELSYTITLNKRIDYEHLVEQWDNFLSLAASIKLGTSKPP